MCFQIILPACVCFHSLHKLKYSFKYRKVTDLEGIKQNAFLYIVSLSEFAVLAGLANGITNKISTIHIPQFELESCSGDLLLCRKFPIQQVYKSSPGIYIKHYFLSF